MEEFTFVVNFRGHCAFVPRVDGKKMWVFLTDESRANEDADREKLRAHHAAILCSTEYIRGQEEVPKADILWRLSCVDLKFLPGGSEPTEDSLEIPCFGDNATLSIPGVFKPDGCFHWIASLEDACLSRGHQAGGGTLNPGFTESTLEDDLAKLLAARLQLRGGRIIVTGYGADVDRYVVWRFRPFAGTEEVKDLRQVLAFDVSLEMVIPYPYIRIEAYKLRSIDKRKEEGDEEDDYEVMDLYPVYNKDLDRWEVVIFIFNEESDQYLPNTPQVEFRFKSSRKRDRIFESYYNLSKNPPPPGDGPLPVADYHDGPIGEGGANFSPPCSPARFVAVKS